MIKQILYTACVTPFIGDAIDYASLEKILKEQEVAGNGIVLFGSTGEGLSLSHEEKQKAMQYVSKMKLNTEIVVGVPSHNLSAALEWIDFCNTLTIQGYLFTTPIYTKPGIVGQTQWFKTLLDKASHPAILYNIPGRSAVRLHTEVVDNLANHPRFLAIKDSGGTVDSLVEYKIAAPNIAVYCGDDYLMPAMAAEGAIGLISVASNAWPSEVRRYVDSAIKGETISDNHKLWWQAAKALFAASNPIPIKALLKEIGTIQSDAVRLPLSREDLKSVKELLHYHDAITHFFRGDNEQQ